MDGNGETQKFKLKPENHTENLTLHTGRRGGKKKQMKTKKGAT